ncbi:MAG TPA: glycosyltransferase family A protein [Oscillospiraceae bacterium]|nr:glycosyltransferase family A protein [Oscillospiraceae bacterium]HPS34888.1 glycosyltransferase family A protein [Oscillospiraceae bacterium]
MPKISVLIPSYNYGRFLGNCLDSVFAQTYRDFEVIVADDGSTDDTEEITRSYPVRYFKLEHRGISATRNFLLEQAAGDFISFVDSDDICMPEKLAVQIAEFKKDPDLQAVFSAVEIWIDPEVREVNECVAAESENVTLYFPSALFRKEAVERCGEFDETLRIGEDTAYMSKFHLLNLKYSVLPLKLYRRRFHNNNTIYTRNAIEDRELLLRIVRNIRRNLNEK